MKKKLIILLMVLVGGNSVRAQYFPVDTAKLNTAFQQLKLKKSNTELQQAYFNAFPDNWKEFFMTYQSVPNGDYDQKMHHLAHQQIDLFNHSLNSIEENLYLKKIINIALGATLSTNVTQQFQNLLHRYMGLKMDKMLHILSKLNEGDQMQFWQFYWSTAAKKKAYETEKNCLAKINSNKFPQTTKIMSVAFDYFYDGVTLRNNFPNQKKQ